MGEGERGTEGVQQFDFPILVEKNMLAGDREQVVGNALLPAEGVPLVPPKGDLVQDVEDLLVRKGDVPLGSVDELSVESYEVGLVLDL